MAKSKPTPAPAKRKTPQRKEGGSDSGRVLLFFLIFSIILNLGLGVATYFGFQHDDALKVANADLAKKNKEFKDEREWFQFQILSLRAYMGQLKADDKDKLGDLRDKFDRGQLAATVPVKDRDEVNALFKTTLEKDRGLKWDATKKEVSPTYETLLAAAKTTSETLAQEAAALRTAKDKAANDKALVEKELKDEKDNSEKNLRDVQQAANKNLDKYFVAVQEANKKVEELSTAQATARTGDDSEKRKVEQQLKIEQAKTAGYKAQLQNKDAIIARLEKDLGKDAPGELKTDWRIVSIDKNGTTAYINLGSADKVTSGLTFRVHGIGEDGKPKQRDKATVEVLNVVGDHLSQVRVLYDYDERKEPAPQRHNPRRDPVLKGDVLYNPTWDPYQKKHIAIAGMIDLVGDGRDSLPELLRSLERQNVIVDAYLDTKDFIIKGSGITVNTDLLIVGPTPRSLQDPRGADKELRDKLDEGVRKMKKQAEENGVKIRGLRQWLEEIGYKVPRGVIDEPVYSSPYTPTKAAEPVAPPAVKPEPPKKPEMPADKPEMPEKPPEKP